jgi:Putative glucose uptake permease
MSGPLFLWLTGASVIFLAAGSILRHYVDRPSVWLLAGALVLYSAGNLMMIRLMKESGMAVALSVSAVLQLVLVNLVALVFFGERPGNMQMGGIALGIVAVALIVWPAAGRQG